MFFYENDSQHKVKMKMLIIIPLLLVVHSLNSFTKTRFIYSRQLLCLHLMNHIEARFLSSIVEFPDHEEKWNEGEVSWNITDVPKKNNKTMSTTLRLDYIERLAFLFI